VRVIVVFVIRGVACKEELCFGCVEELFVACVRAVESHMFAHRQNAVRNRYVAGRVHVGRPERIVNGSRLLSERASRKGDALRVYKSIDGRLSQNHSVRVF
jgi:hypothetical protein